MVMFNSYVKLPEGNIKIHIQKHYGELHLRPAPQTILLHGFGIRQAHATQLAVKALIKFLLPSVGVVNNNNNRSNKQQQQQQHQHQQQVQVQVQEQVQV